MSSKKITIFIIVVLIFGVFHFSYAVLDLSGAPGFCKYLRNLFTTLLSLAAFLAVLMIVIAGSQWVAAAGNPSTIADSKDMIWKAIIGLILAFASWMILETINPDLVGFSGCAQDFAGSLQTQGLTQAQQRELARQRQLELENEERVAEESVMPEAIQAPNALELGRMLFEYNPQDRDLTEEEKKQIEEVLNTVDDFNDKGERIPEKLQQSTEKMMATLYENRHKLDSDLRKRVEEVHQDYQIHNQAFGGFDFGG